MAQCFKFFIVNHKSYFIILVCRGSPWNFVVAYILYIYIYYHPHHQVVLLAQISQTLSLSLSLSLSLNLLQSFIALCRSLKLQPVSEQSCCRYVLASQPALTRPCVGAHRRTSHEFIFASSPVSNMSCSSYLYGFIDGRG